MKSTSNKMLWNKAQTKIRKIHTRCFRVRYLKLKHYNLLKPLLCKQIFQDTNLLKSRSNNIFASNF